LRLARDFVPGKWLFRPGFVITTPVKSCL